MEWHRTLKRTLSLFQIVQQAARKVLAWMAKEGLYTVDVLGLEDQRGRSLVERVILEDPRAGLPSR